MDILLEIAIRVKNSLIIKMKEMSNATVATKKDISQELALKVIEKKAWNVINAMKLDILLKNALMRVI